MNRDDNQLEVEGVLNLRRKAEVFFKQRQPKIAAPLSESDALRLVHELEVHQIELELIIDELSIQNKVNEQRVEDLLRANIENENLTKLNKESTDKFRLIAKQVPGVVYQYRLRPDGSSCFPYASEAIMKICGVTPEDLQEDGSKAFLNLLPEDYEHLLVSTQESAKNLTPWQHEYRVRYDNGSIHTLYGDALPQLEADGSILWHGIITDITERKKTEEALKHSEQKYHTLVESASVGILVAQGDGLKFVNPNFIELSGYSETELLSMSFLDLVYADDQEQLMISYNNRLSDQATNNNYSLRMG